MMQVGRHLKLLGIVFLTLPALASTGPGYLATVGPAPLRFWSPSKPKPAPAVADAPSPAVSNEAATPNPYDFLAAFGAPTPVTAPAPAPDVTNATPPAASVNMNAATQVPQFAAPQPGDVVSPQMLLQYFNKGTNGVGVGIIAPLNMSVPNNPTPPPSSATYSN